MKRFIICIAACVVCFACNKNSSEQDKPQAKEREDIVLTKSQQELISFNNEFGLDLFRQTLAQEKGEFMISPMSMWYALSMLANGAAGDTRSQILNAIGFPANRMHEVNELAGYLSEELTKVDNTVDFSMANSLVANTAKAHLKKAFCDSLSNYYNALLVGYNFDAENAKALAAINDWASKHTHGMIDPLLDSLNPSYYLLLMNAIYFKGNWNSEITFKTSDTKKDDFTLADGNKTKVDYMHTQVAQLGYSSGQNYSRVRMPYGNGAFVLDVILPNEGKTVEEVVKSLKQSDLTKQTAGCRVDLKLPKFETSATIDFVKILQNLGIINAFVAADFSVMTDDDVCVAEVFQKSKIKVNETGTESAAVTVITMKYTSAGPGDGPETIIEFHAVRPFIYAISEVSSNAILFMGTYKGK